MVRLQKLIEIAVIESGIVIYDRVLICEWVRERCPGSVISDWKRSYDDIAVLWWFLSRSKIKSYAGIRLRLWAIVVEIIENLIVDTRSAARSQLVYTTSVR